MIDPPESPRLVAERLVADHHDALCVLLGDPRVGATLGGAMSPEQVATALALKIEHWDRNGFGYWLWRERASGDAVARGGLHRAHVGGRDEVEVGWAVVPERWGEGFATELGAASLRVAFDVLELPDVVAYTLPGNVASRRVMEKLGMEFKGDVVHAGLPHVLYRRAAGV